MCGCGHKGHHKSGHHGCSCGCGGHHGCSCGCDEHSRFGPNFWTKDEKIAWLEKRLDDLREQVKAVEERIAALKAE
jgi:hypothetical protein